MTMNGAGRWVRALVASLAVASLVACGSSSDEAPVDPANTGRVSGLVVSAATGAPLAGATVASGGVSTRSGADGRYTLVGVTPGAAVLSFSAAGHARNFANATVVVGATAGANARLTPVGATQTVPSATGGTVALAGTPAQVTLPAGGIVDRNGAAYTGPVTVELTPINPALDPANMPGDMTTSAGGSVRPIESFGALTVNLSDAGGNRLNLASGQTATIRIPLATRSPAPPATIPLFYFNEATGLWVEEGTAMLAGTAPNQYYEGTVGHFTVWNADQVMETVYVTGCVQDAAGRRVAGATVRSDGMDYSGLGFYSTDSSGNYRVPVRSTGRAAVMGFFGPNAFSNTRIVTTSRADVELLDCLTLGNGAPVFVQQPASPSVTEGGWVVLQAIAQGNAPLRYQWQRDGVDIAGATATMLLIDPVTSAHHGAVYRLLATNDVASTPSQEATLTVAPLPPAIATQPAAVSVVAGQSVTFTVQMLPQGAPLQYQWRRNGVDIPNAIQASYKLDGVQLGDSGARFSVRISNSVGHVDSDEAVLTVSAAPVGPSITTQPAALSVNVGQSATFAVVASGSAPLAYQWRRNGTVIEGAREASYTINATVLADNGAVFSVVVGNAVDTVTSANATLTVTEPPSGSGYYHIGRSGALVQTAVLFANGSQTNSSQALVAVASANPAAGAVTVEPAGKALQVAAAGIETTIAGGRASQTRQRYSYYFKNSRLHRLDHTTPGGAPVGQVVSTLTLGELCGDGGQLASRSGLDSLDDLADVRRSWVLLPGPGADGICESADDVLRAVRADMGSTDAALTLAGRPLVEIIGADGALQGVIVVEGSTLKRLDAGLANPTNLMVLSGPLFQENGFIFGNALPGIWLFMDDGNLYAYRLDGSGGAPAVIAQRQGYELGYGAWNATAGNGAAYVSMAAQGIRRLLRIGSDLVVSEIATLDDYIIDLRATPTRLLVLANAGLYSQPLAGGAATLVAVTSELDDIYDLQVAGETVYVSRVTSGGLAGRTRRIVRMRSDGSDPQTLDASVVVATLLPPSVPLTALMEDHVDALVVAVGVNNTNLSDAQLRAVDAATGLTRVVYGVLPTVSGELTVSAEGLYPAHYGQTGLFSTLSTVNGLSSAGLLFIDTDAVGLIEITAPVTLQGSRWRPLTRQAFSAGTLPREGLKPKPVRRGSALRR